MSMNMNDMAILIADKEGLRESLSIAQIKEVLRITLLMLAEMPYADVAKILGRLKK
jgi:hypothetical protein